MFKPFSAFSGFYKLKYFVLVSLLSICIYPQKINKDLDNYLSTYFNSKNIPSISAGVAQNGKIIWLGARGYADIENLIHATSKTVYRIASISKSITAVAIMQLVEEGKIKLDEDARNYIPYFPAKKWKFTTRQLLSHTSGIRDYRGGEFDNKKFFKSTKDVSDYLAVDSLMYEPGTRYVYSTLGYNLLAAIIENVSKLSFSDYLKKNIFEPSGMTSTYLELQQEIVYHRARGYIKNVERKIKNAPLADLSIKYAGGGVISTSEDLLKFAISLMDGKLIKLSTLDTMLVKTKLKNNTIRDYGLGFNPGTDNSGRKYFLHLGGGTGFCSLLIMYPSEKLAAVHLINIRDRDLDSAAITLASIVMKKNYILPKKSVADYLVNLVLSSNIDSVISEYKRMRTGISADYEFTIDELNLFGADLLTMERYTDAIKFYRSLLNDYPKNINAHIGLADAYQKDGNIGLAITSYRKVLRMDPLNYYADSMIKKLNKNNN